MTTVSDHDESLWITSLRDHHDLGNACQITWGGREWFAGVGDVRQTAEDMFTAAAYADTIGQLLRIGMEGAHITAMISSMLSRRDRKFFGSKSTVSLTPAGSSKRRVGLVIVKRGSLAGELTADETRAMGRRWLVAAEASEAATLFAQVLQRSGWMEHMELDALFGLLQDIRSGQATVPPQRGEEGGL